MRLSKLAKNAQPPSRPSGQWLLLAIIATALLALVPIWATRFIPANDYPFHLARMVILSQLDNPIFARFYEQGSFFLPNMAMDAIAVPLSAIFGPEMATRVFVELTLLLILFGAVILNWAAYRRPSLWPLLAIVFLHNGIFRFGFFNYLFGLGAALVAAAVWIALKPGLGRLGVAFVSCLLLIYCHLEAFCIFGVIVGSIELERAYSGWRQKHWTVFVDLLYSASPFLVCLILFFILSPTAGQAANGISYAAGLGTKPVGALFTLSSGILWLDALSAACIAALCAWLAITRQLTLSRPLAFATVMMGLALFVVPSEVVGATYADVRLGPVIALLAVAALGLRTEASRSATYAVFALIVGLGAVRAGALTATWSGYNDMIGTIVNAVDKIEPGSTLFAATSDDYPIMIADTPERRAVWSPSLKHVASYAVLGSPVFVPMTWAEPTQQPLNVKANYQAPYKFQANNPRKVYDAEALPQFIGQIEANIKSGAWRDLGPVYVLVVGTSRTKIGALPSSVARVNEGERFELLRVTTTGAPP